jgi:hypothetical protein
VSKIGGSAISHHVTDLQKRPARDAHGPAGPAGSHITSVVVEGEKRYFCWRFLIKGYFKKPISQKWSAMLAPTLL